MIENLKKYKTFSFPLDGVLIDEIDGSINPNKDEMQELVKELIKNGKQVFIITKRYDKNDYDPFSRKNKNKKELLEESEIAEKIADKLNLDRGNIIFTNRNNYFSYFSDTDTHCHFDTSKYEIALLKEWKPSIKTFNIKER